MIIKEAEEIWHGPLYKQDHECKAYNATVKF